MLSIGKLENHTGKAAGSYYTQSVAHGREDYYAGRGEDIGRWMGTGLKAVGLTGEVREQDFLAVIAGRDPATGEWLARPPRGGQRTPGFDLTFSAPKSVSVLWGLAGESVSGDVQEAHDVAVASALGFIEERAAFTRRGYLGRERLGTTGLIVGAFRHRTSRAGDPALHTHCVVANVVKGTDGKWSSLDARLLYAWGKTAGYLYQAALRKELVTRLGVEWGEVHRGTAEIRGIAPEVCRAFSQRRQEIEALLRVMGETSAKAAQIATLDTRKSKEYGVDGATLHERWRSRGERLGVTVESLESVTGRERLRALGDAERQATAERLSSPTGLTQRQSNFGQREAIQAWCDQLRQGGDVPEVLGLTRMFLATDVIVVGKAQELRGRDVIRREDGKVVATGADEYRYSTPEMLATERRLVELATARQGANVAVAAEGATRRAIANRPYLGDEQVAMVMTLTRGGDAVAIVVGRPGAGKTTALDACRDAWESSGQRVIGCALAAETARTLQRESGIESYTVHQLLADLADPEHGGLARDSVIVVDEAAMVGTRQLLPLVEAARTHGAKVVLVGDDHQLPEIDAGGAFRGLRQRCASVELTENRRQREAWERDALEQLRSGRVAEAIAAYQSRDALVIGHDADEVRRQLVDDWFRARSAGDGAEQAVMIAGRNTEVERLNEQARAMRKAAGELVDGIEIAGREFSIGDRVVAMKNSRGLGVRNGTRGTVAEIDNDQHQVSIDTDGGTRVDLPESYASRRLRHAYALTAHKAQGKTVSQAFVLASDDTSREWAFTALSRGRDQNRLYVIHAERDQADDVSHGVTPVLDAFTTLERSLARTAAKTMAIDSPSDAPAGSLMEQRLRELEQELQVSKQLRGEHDRSRSDDEDVPPRGRERGLERGDGIEM